MENCFLVCSAFWLYWTPPSTLCMDQSHLSLFFWTDFAIILSCAVIGRAQTLTNQHWGHIWAQDLLQFGWWLLENWSPRTRLRVNRISFWKRPLRPWHVSSPFFGLFFGPRCPWGPIYGSWCQSVHPRLFADLTDVTLADEDSNSIQLMMSIEPS